MGVVDRRFTDIPQTDTVFDPPIPETSTVSLAEWERRRDRLRTHIKVASGIFPEPIKCDLNARITGETEIDGALIQNVRFQSYPGFYVTGNLYRPTKANGPMPGIACPHGHAEFGRFEDTERFSVPARCVTLARHGNVVYSYDMVGYNDSRQFKHDYATERAYLWGVSLLGLQTWNSVRVIDYLQSLDDVDDEQIACVGASGGGTQTFLLTAIDDRVKVCAPVVMVSAHMQGGCLCENAPHLRLHANNVEIAAMAAPRPMILISATGDWTKNTPTVEYPAIREVYRLYCAEDRLREVQVDAGHNFNHETRQAVYEWMGRWLRDDEDASRWTEPPYELPSVEKLRVFPSELPADSGDGEAVLGTIISAAQAQLEELYGDGATLRKLYEHTLNVDWPDEVDAIEDADGLTLSRHGKGDAIRAALTMPEGKPKSVVVVAASNGIDDFDDEPLLNAGHAVLRFDAFRTGAAADQEREEPRHFLTFNLSDTANRVQDLLTAASYAFSVGDTVNVMGVGDGGIWATLALPYLDRVGKVVIHLDDFERSDETFSAAAYVPGLRRAGDFVAAAILRAPRALRVYGVSDPTPYAPVERAFDAKGATGALTGSPYAPTIDDIIEYLD